MPLSEILVAANVLPQHVDHLLNEGWTAEHFGVCATSIEEFDTVMAKILEGPLTHLNKAALRLAWTRCQPGSTSAIADIWPARAAGLRGQSAIWVLVRDLCAQAQCVECQSVEGHLQEELPGGDLTSGEFPESSVTVNGGTSETKNEFQMDPMEV